MSADFAELDYRQTPLGDLVLRRRRLRALDGLEVYEVKLGEAFLMSSLFHDVEVALANLGLAELGGAPADVVVGGLGLGYTAAAALDHPGTRSLIVVEALAPVIEWHNRALVPLGARLTGDPRCRLVEGDFFALAAGAGFDPDQAARLFDAVLLDIDHSPRNLLHSRNAAFYEPAGLAALAAKLKPGGVFALWSDDPPEEDFLGTLRGVFAQARAEIVQFPNPLLGGLSSSTVYIARKEAEFMRMTFCDTDRP
jgi:spermidine synthase